MRNFLNKTYNSLWRHSFILGGTLILVYIGMLFLNLTGLEPESTWGSLMGIEAIPLLVTLVMLYLVLSQIAQISAYRKQQKSRDASFRLSIWDIPRGMFIKAIACCMGLMWSIGWMLYTCALWSNYNSDGNYAEILGYAAMASLDLFMLDINGNVIDNINAGTDAIHFVKYPRLLKGVIVLVSILAALCTFVILINLFFSRFAAYLHSKLVKVTPKSNNHIYVFIGAGEKDLKLAKSIAQEDPRHLIVFVDVNENNDPDDIDGWDKVIGHLTLRNPVASKMNQNSHGIFLVSEGSISDFSTAEAQKLTIPDFWASLGLKRINILLDELIKNKPVKLNDKETKMDMDNQVHFFFLSKDRDRNISEANILSEVFTKYTRDQYKNINIIIHAAARKDSVISIIEDKVFIDTKNDKELKGKDYLIKLVDDSRLSVDILKRNPASHPIRFVDIDLTEKPGTVTTPFNAMIIGFGETGRDALRYLYEFSAFYDNKGDGNTRSKVRITVVDPLVNLLSGKFISDRPGLNTPFNIAANGGEPIINFLPLDARSVEFNEYVKKSVTELNYIVVALGDNELNVTVASQLLKLARQYRTNLEKFKIFVRVYDSDSFPHFDDVINHYNKKIKEELEIDSILQTFGSADEVYTYGLVVRDKFTEAGKNYGNSYWAYYQKVSDREKQKREELGYTSTDRKLKEWESVDKKKYNDFEDLQNSLHALTKLYIIESFLRKEKGVPSTDDAKPLWDELFSNFDVTPDGIDTKRDSTPDVIKYTEASNVSPRFDSLLTNLAKTEHLRWNASHEMLGFVYGEQKNYRTMTHPCLLTWDQLPKISETNALRLYDYLVVENTLFMKKLELEAQEKEEEEGNGNNNS